MVGFRVGNTLSESGTVARGICSADEAGHLTTVVERTEIMRVDGVVSYKDEEGKWVGIEDNTPVSMNMWGFTPDYFKYSEDYFVDFLKANIGNIKSEYFIPLMVNKLINEKTATVKVLDTTSKWFGVTYAADRQSVVDKIQALVDAGEYPDKSCSKKLADRFSDGDWQMRNVSAGVYASFAGHRSFFVSFLSVRTVYTLRQNRPHVSVSSSSTIGLIVRSIRP